MAKKDSLSGVTVDGKDLIEWLAEKEGSDRTKEIEQVRASSEHIKVGRHRPWFGRRRLYEERVPLDPGRRWTNEEIRREYGVMAKPFETKMEHVLWLIFEEGPITSTDLVRKVPWEGKINSMTALLAGLWDALGEDGKKILSRERIGGTYRYRRRAGDTTTVEQARELFRQVNRERHRERKEHRERAYATIDALPKESMDGAEPEEKTEQTETAMKSAVRQIAERLFDAELRIKVSGRVEITFKIG